jgi:hypothetical protein
MFLVIEYDGWNTEQLCDGYFRIIRLRRVFRAKELFLNVLRRPAVFGVIGRCRYLSIWFEIT